MKTPDLKDRVEFWKFAYARISFEETCHFSKILAESASAENATIRRALSYAIWTSYGRPFKQNQPVRLSADLVPQEHRATHDLIIKIRDKIIAHRDLKNGLFSKDGDLVSSVQLDIRLKEIISVRTTSPIISDEDARKIFDLSNTMEEKMEYHLDKYRGKIKGFVSHSDGEYFLDFDEKSQDWLKKIEQVK